MKKSIALVVAVLGLSLVVTGCSGSGSSADLVGTWTLTTGKPQQLKGEAQFYKYAFDPAGHVTETYISAMRPGMSNETASESLNNPQSETGTYSVKGNHVVEMTFGSGVTDFAFDINGGQMRLTPTGGDAQVFERG